MSYLFLVAMKKLIVRGASQHNLKSVDLDIDPGSICAFSGPSGSGKSSLVFDTIYSEAQNRFIETFSPYARQFLERLPRARVKKVENLPAAISVGQTNPVKNSRSTVATLSEISFSARMLYHRNATSLCPRCGVPVRVSGWKDVLGYLVHCSKMGKKKAFVCVRTDEEGLKGLLKEGYSRFFLDGKLIDACEPFNSSAAERIHVVTDRLSLSCLSDKRVKEAVEIAFGLGDSSIFVAVDNKDGNIDFRDFSKRPICPSCGSEKNPPGLLLFSFNSPEGACSTCSGFGRVLAIDWDLVIPDASKSVAEGAIRPLENWHEDKELLLSSCIKWGIDIKRPWRELKAEERKAILFGKDEWYGIKGIFDWLETKRYKPHIRILLSRYRAFEPCPSCKGARFNNEALSYVLAGLNIAQFYNLSVFDAINWCKKVAEESHLDKASLSLMEELVGRLKLIKRAGLGYLTLDRQSRTLSGGELSRLCLAKGVSVGLCETLYCLDEPSCGLHPADIKGIGQVLRGLKASENTILMTENDEAMCSFSDRVIRMGPGSGRDGGQIVKDSPPDVRQKRGLARLFEKAPRPSNKAPFLVIRGLCQNNLKDITCRIPIGHVTCVCGVSGSGKSTMVEECLYRGLLRRMGIACQRPGAFDSIELPQDFRQVVFIDQEPVTRTPRACPGTYLKILDPIRRLFANTSPAKILGLGPGYFSLNVDGGRCTACKGQGFEMVDMQFLPDVMVPCPQCNGARFSKEAQQIRLRGKNIRECLEMTLSQVQHFFRHEKAVVRALEPAISLGLGHLLLGQPLNTLSAGDAQRLKIARHMAHLKDTGCLFILDEPTRGLFKKEVLCLMDQLHKLASAGNTVVIVEHDLSVMGLSNWLIELGPEGGDGGGHLLFEGCPKDLLRMDTPTSKAIKELEGRKKVPSKSSHSKDRSKKGVIEIRGARHNNLKDLDIDIPRNRLVVVTGVSGSGKSTLAFDLIYKEAQRRYLESLPSYMKQFVRLYERGDVDSVRGLSPSVAIEQKAVRGSSMSTVATLSETAHYLRLLYAHCSTPVCQRCNERMSQATRQEITDTVADLREAGPFFILSPRIRHRKGVHKREIELGFANGAYAVMVDDKVLRKGDPVRLSRFMEHTIFWMYGPVEPGLSRQQLDMLVKKALKAGGGTLVCLFDHGSQKWLSTKYFCNKCKISVDEPDPLLFSFHTKVGRCAECLGSGRDESGNPCVHCEGRRLSPKTRIFKIGGLDISSLMALEVDEILEVFSNWQRNLFIRPDRRRLFSTLSLEITRRLRLMSDLGLGYLSLDRSGESLSGGESQRISLSAQAASTLTGITLVLDEPTIGLHPVDNRRLVKALRALRDKGNSVIVVEHDEDTILESDHVIDLGPGGGKEGGRVVFQGSVQELLRHSGTKTAKCLRKGLPEIKKSRRIGKGTVFLQLKGVSKNNLSFIDIDIPLGAVTVVTGVSGSGKTSLKEALMDLIEQRGDVSGTIYGAERLKGLLNVDHSPIGRTPRSCPATFIGILSHIRELFSRTPASRVKGFGPAHFSFNTKEGSCPHCKGQGQLRQKLGILPDVYVECPECLGKRFRQEVLSIKWKSKDISQVLSMTVSEALEFFRPVPSIRRGLKVLSELGLGYLSLGQPSPSLSGGEAQRLKIAKELSRPQGMGRLYLLDEPSVGLHVEDVERLSRCLSRLSENGNTVFIIEHNLSIISMADWIIDLGPGGGRHGGKVMYQGPLFDFVSSDTRSPTLESLRNRLNKS